MAYDENLAARVRTVLSEHEDVDERMMFGGIAYMIRGHMCCGVLNNDLVLRLDPDAAKKLLRSDHVRPMDFTGRPMKGFVFVAPAGIRSDALLRRRIQSAVDFVGTLPVRKPRRRTRR